MNRGHGNGACADSGGNSSSSAGEMSCQDFCNLLEKTHGVSYVLFPKYTFQPQAGFPMRDVYLVDPGDVPAGLCLLCQAYIHCILPCGGRYSSVSLRKRYKVHCPVLATGDRGLLPRCTLPTMRRSGTLWGLNKA